MTIRKERTTIYFDLDLHRVLKLKSTETSRSISEMVNDAVRLALSEDSDDLAVFNERINEPVISFKDLLNEIDI